MFCNLRQGSQLFVLHKSATPYIEMGVVDNTSNIACGYFPTMPAMPVNISVRIADKVTPYQNLPPNAEVAEATNNATGETITIACTKEALNAEIQAMKQKSIETINSVEYHKQRIGVCETLLQQINPEQAEKAEQAKQINELRQQVANLTSQLTALNGQLKAGSETSHLKPEKQYEHDNHTNAATPGR